MFRRCLSVLTLALLISATAMADKPFPAHRIVGNTYYVGSDALAVFLITTPEGHFLINSGFEETVPLIQKSVESLGFKMSDVKILLESHAHSDHVAGHARLQKLTGAKVYVMRGDHSVIASGGQGQYLYTDSRWPACRVDRVLDDGDQVKLGGAKLIAHRTPGHTRGCTTWAWQATEGDKNYDVVVIGSPNVNPGFRLVANRDYPQIAKDFAKTFAVLKKLPCDIFLGAHGNYYGMHDKYQHVKAAKANPFIDPKGYRSYVAEKEKAYLAKLVKQRAEQASGIAETLKSFVDQRQVAGAVTLVARRGRVVHLESVGQRDIENALPMKKGSLFAIASMTKPITGTAIMILQDDGKLSVDDPVLKYIPQFANVRLKNGSPPKRPITIRDLMTHTSGVTGTQEVKVSLKVAAEAIASEPLAFQPGTKWQYSPGLNVCARIIEIVSEQSFNRFLDERIFGPLKMSDTTFYPTATQQKRLATLYKPGNSKDQRLVATKHWISDPSADRPPNGSSSLFSTAADMARFYQMILDGGELDGRRIVSKASVQAMTRVQTAELEAGFTSGCGWGFGWGVVREPQGVTKMLSPGTFGHGGALGTQGWVDPKRKMVFVLMIQRIGFGNGDAADIRREFQQRAVDNLTGTSAN